MIKKIFLIFATAIFLFSVFVLDIFTGKSFLSLGKNLLSQYSGGVYQENKLLKQENSDLKAQIQQYRIISLRQSGENYSGNILDGNVFSNYPFNPRSIIVIDRGSRDGVQEKMAAVKGRNILVGQVSKVYESVAEIKTIFDPRWQLPVKIGEEKINGLFQGGNDPKIIFVEKPVKAGDPIFTASQDVPFNLKIGDVKEFEEKNGASLGEAFVSVPYNINDLDSVSLIPIR